VVGPENGQAQWSSSLRSAQRLCDLRGCGGVWLRIDLKQFKIDLRLTHWLQLVH
jgi:hypothetical protein